MPSDGEALEPLVIVAARDCIGRNDHFVRVVDQRGVCA